MSMPTDSGATDVNGAARRMSALFQEPELERPTGEGEAPSQASEEAITPDVAAESNQDVSETPESVEGDTEEVSRRFKAKLGDRDVEFELLTDDVDIDLIPKGLMMEADYRKKTMELGDNRKAFEAKQQELDAKFHEAAELIQFEADNLESQEMLELKEYDPDAYWKKFDQLKKKADKLTEWRQKQNEKLEKQNAELIKAQQDKLTDVIPDWLDSGKKEADLTALKPYLTDLGFNEQELAVLGAPTDVRVLAMARKAMMFDAISSQDIEAKRVKQKAKSVEPSGGQRPNAQQEHAKKLNDRLKRTGKLSDAQAAIKEMFKL